MFEVVASGQNGSHRRRLALNSGGRYVVGRSPRCDLPIAWDPAVSREHAVLLPQIDHVLVTKHAKAGNPLYFCGREVESCRVETGGHFVVGETVIELVPATSGLTTVPLPPESPVTSVSFSHQKLRAIRYPDAENRLEVLTHLPEVIAGATNDNELYHRIVSLLLRGLVHAEAIAIVALHPSEGLRILHWDRRRETAGQFQPSRRLAQEALSSQPPQSVLHVWDPQVNGDDPHTMAADFDWAYCTPVPGLHALQAGFYVAGKTTSERPGATLSDDTRMEADVKFTELVAEIISSVLKARRMERQKAGLRQFFAPPILAALGDDLDTTLLEPCECDVTVMFCDLRGFSQSAERAAGDLIGLLDRVSRALGVMTQEILLHGGVTGDFQGDATLGFWGWPFPSPEAAVNACRAALGIRAAFTRTSARKDHPLADFAMGIGIAHGRAVAGKIGTADQVKVTVFGPVVNLASRLEGMTKQFRVPVLVDETTASLVRERLPHTEGRFRRLARVQPYGMDRPVVINELLPPESEYPLLSDEHLASYDKAVDAFIAGDWEAAYHDLHTVPSGDRAQDFLMQQIALHNRQPPADWDGTVRLAAK